MGFLGAGAGGAAFSTGLDATGAAAGGLVGLLVWMVRCGRKKCWMGGWADEGPIHRWMYGWER